MANLRRWSSSASGNATVTGGANAINFAEGQFPGTVNNSAREVMAQIRTAYTPTQWNWIEFSATASIASQTSIKLPGNQTTDWAGGRRWRLKSGSTTRYGYVVSSSYTVETTVTVTVDAGSLSQSHTLAALSAITYNTLPGSGFTFSNVTALLADTGMTYTSGLDLTVTPGQSVYTQSEGFSYLVQSSGATTNHVVTAGGVKLNVVPGERGYNVKAFGAKGDASANDSTAITTAVVAGYTNSYPVHFPASTYLCNLSLSGTNALWGSKINWEGDGRSLTILKAFDNTKDTVRFIASDELSFQRFKGFQVDGNGGTANHAWRVDKNLDSLYEDCMFHNAWIAFRQDSSFGCTFSNCRMGDSSSYGYVGIGTSTAYCGWHTFQNGVMFRGSKVAYLVDNYSAPSAQGNGNLHERSDFQNITGLSVFIRNQFNREEIWRNVWFESNATSGTVDLTDLPTPTSSIGTIDIPTSGIQIWSGSGATTEIYKRTRLLVEGTFQGAAVTGDAEIMADRLVGAVTKSTATSATQAANVLVRTRSFDPYQPSATYAVAEAYADRLEYNNGLGASSTYVQFTLGALGKPKTRFDFNDNLLNRFKAASIDATGVSTGFLFSGSGSVTVSTAQGGIQGRCYVVTLTAGEEVDLMGTENTPGTSLDNAIAVFTVPVGFSFAIKASASAYMPLELRSVQGLDASPTRSTIGNLIATNDWKNYNFITSASAFRPGIKNTSGSTVVFYLTDMQAIDAGGASVARIVKHNLVLDFITTEKLAGALTGGTKVTP